MKRPLEQCPVCGGTLEQKLVEKILRGGHHTATLRVLAEVCQHCGERLYAEQSIRKFEEIRSKLEHQDTSGLEPVGIAFEAK